MLQQRITVLSELTSPVTLEPEAENWIKDVTDDVVGTEITV
jgi:hypothetical protein